jgi:hypothetical protein
MLERQILSDLTIKGIRWSACAWVWTTARWVAADFSDEPAHGDAFERHICGEHPFPVKA